LNTIHPKLHSLREAGEKIMIYCYTTYLHCTNKVPEVDHTLILDLRLGAGDPVAAAAEAELMLEAFAGPPSTYTDNLHDPPHLLSLSPAHILEHSVSAIAFLVGTVTPQ
jgi:hypothetical protein